MTASRDPLNAFLDLPQVPVANAQSGPLSGLSLAVKDIFDVAGYRTGCGNPKKYSEATAAAKSAPSIQKLFDAGARFVGKTQTDELAYSLMGQNAHFPFPINPIAPDRVTGGSSSGSAAAVAGGLADIAIGSDTGGSIRAPASFCGLIGLRTSHGRISLDGAMKLASSLDTFGWFARDMDIYETVGNLLLGNDAEGIRLQRPLFMGWQDALITGQEEAAEYKRLKTIAARSVGEPQPVQFSATAEQLYWCFRHIQADEAWTEHGAWISSGNPELGPGVKERFDFGRTQDPEDVKRERARRLTVKQELADLLGDDGFLVLPTVPGAAPLKDAGHDALLDYRERALKLLCLSGLSGFPQLTLPLGTVHGAPFGLSLLGPAGSDKALLKLGRKILDAAKG
ncbi:amidase [Mesorhizobium sp. Root552]|uniref:amidase n=1 Tax=Mesorhizobium sp. Root552 TaxID=1736555 RepID=UPI000701D8E6|nr:amidase [Mesorhizobium sp. Root552]KQZ12220.1 amidase [Mesorhizobium sp. Root552]